jgi:hypothetical protein
MLGHILDFFHHSHIYNCSAPNMSNRFMSAVCYNWVTGHKATFTPYAPEAAVNFY